MTKRLREALRAHRHLRGERVLYRADGGVMTESALKELVAVMPKDMPGFRIETDGIARIPEELAVRLGRHRMEVGDTVYGRRGDIGSRPCRSPSAPQGIWDQLYAEFIDQRFYGDNPNVLTRSPRASNEMRTRLFRMVADDTKRRETAYTLLGHIEDWRLDYGRPPAERRHPDN